MLGQKYSIILQSLMYVYHFEPSKGSTRIIKSIFYSGKSSHIFIYSLDLYVECFFCCCRQYNVKDFLLFILLLFWIYKKIQIWYLLTVSTPWEILIFKIILYADPWKKIKMNYYSYLWTISILIFQLENLDLDAYFVFRRSSIQGKLNI